jgi:hypothetical protein
LYKKIVFWNSRTIPTESRLAQEVLLNMTTLQVSELHLKMSIGAFVEQYLRKAGWSGSAPESVYTTQAYAAPEHVNITQAYAAPGYVWTIGAFADYTTGAWAALGLIYTTVACMLHLNMSTLHRPMLHRSLC